MKLPKCSECRAEGYHESDCSRKYVKDHITLCEVRAGFQAERYPDMPLLDTNVDIKIDTFCIIWEKRNKLVQELLNVIEKYKI